MKYCCASDFFKSESHGVFQIIVKLIEKTFKIPFKGKINYRPILKTMVNILILINLSVKELGAVG